MERIYPIPTLQAKADRELRESTCGNRQNRLIRRIFGRRTISFRTLCHDLPPPRRRSDVSLCADFTADHRQSITGEIRGTRRNRFSTVPLHRPVEKLPAGRLSVAVHPTPPAGSRPAYAWQVTFERVWKRRPTTFMSVDDLDRISFIRSRPTPCVGPVGTVPLRADLSALDASPPLIEVGRIPLLRVKTDGMITTPMRR